MITFAKHNYGAIDVKLCPWSGMPATGCVAAPSKRGIIVKCEFCTNWVAGVIKPPYR